MTKRPKLLSRVVDFWKKRVKERKIVLSGGDFPDEYVRKLLQKEGLLFPLKKGLYLLKNKGKEAESLVYQEYWLIIEKVLEGYEPWSIEKESALAIYVGDESIPQKLLVRTGRKVKYSLSLPFEIKIEIRPDPSFHEQTRRSLDITGAKIFLDVPEKVLFHIHERKGIKFKAFLKAVKFDWKMLDVLYALNPKPIIAKKLIKAAEENGREDLSQILRKNLKDYTLYRP